MTRSQAAAVYLAIGSRGRTPPDARLCAALAEAVERERVVRERIRRAIREDVARRRRREAA